MTTATETVNKAWADNLTHMLGAGSNVPRGSRGYRNYFCASVSEPPVGDYAVMLAMEAAGLVEKRHTINEGTSRYFIATRAGCAYIGLSKAATARAFKE